MEDLLSSPFESEISTGFPRAFPSSLRQNWSISISSDRREEVVSFLRVATSLVIGGGAVQLVGDLLGLEN